MRRCVMACLFALVGTNFAHVTDFEGRPAVVFSNGKIELTVTLAGATLANLILLEDPNRLSPLWNEVRAVRMAGGSSMAAGELV